MAREGLLGTGLQSRSRKVRRKARRAIARQPAQPAPTQRPAQQRGVARSVPGLLATTPKHTQQREHKIAHREDKRAKKLLPILAGVKKPVDELHAEIRAIRHPDAQARALEPLLPAVKPQREQLAKLPGRNLVDYLTSPPPPKKKKFEIAGLSPASAIVAGADFIGGPVGAGVALTGEAVAGIGAAFAEDPSGTTKSSLRSAKESITGIPQGVKMLVEDPGKAIPAIAKDYENRYGPLLSGDLHTFKERVKKDYGITPYALDATAGAGTAGKIAGALAKTEAAGRLGARLAEMHPPFARVAGKAVGGAHRMVTDERPRVRISGGEGGTVRQPTSTGMLHATMQRTLDRARGRKFGKVAEKHGFKVGEGGKLEPIEGATQTPMPALRPGAGEVLPYYSLKESPVLRKFTGRTERAHGRRKSSERLRLLQEGGNLEREARKAIKPLDGKEEDALLYTMQFGLSPAKRGEAIAALEKYRGDIVRNRKHEGAVLPYEPDELPVLDRIIAAPEEHITPRVRQVADRLSELEHQAAAKDTALTAERAADRRILPQSILLGARRAPDVAEFEGRLRSIEQRFRDRGVDPGNLVEKFGGLGELEPNDRLPVVRELEKALRGEKGKAERALATAERQAARVKAVVKERETRGAPLETPDVRSARAELSVARRERKRLRRSAGSQRERAAVAQGRAEVLSTQERASVERQLGEARSAAAAHVSAGETAKAERRLADVKRLEERLGTTPRRTLSKLERERGASLERDVAHEQAHQRVLSAKQKLDAELEKAPRVSEAIAKREREAEQKVLQMRARRDDARIDHLVSARLKGEVKARPGRYESSAAFHDRVSKAAEEAGLQAPAYFESAGGHELRRSVKAIGTGIRGAADSKSYTGARLRMGRQSGDPEIVVQALLRNAKRRFSWRFTVNTVNQSAFEWSRGPHGGGLTARELDLELRRRHIDPDTVEFVNVRVLENRELDAEGLTRGQVVNPDDATPGVHPDDLAGVGRGLDEAHVSGEQIRQEADTLSRADVRGQGFNRYVAIPKRDYDELAAATRPDGFAMRAIDILWKQKPARIMLGLANVPWLAFQVMSNGFVAGLGGALNPFDYVAAQRWWRKLTPDEKLAIEPELGITHQHHAIVDQTYLGAATNNRLIDAYRAFKQTKVMRTLHKGNPLDLMFRADEAQNNFFRRTVLYRGAKRDAYARMGKTWSLIDRAQNEIVSVLPKASTRSLDELHADMRAITKNAELFTRHAEHVREFLGDYLTFTAKERRVLARSVMFYGYLRFSLRFVFWTMPVKHPVVAAITSDIGRMGAQEVKRLLDVPMPGGGSVLPVTDPATGYRAEDVPTSMLANMYVHGGMIPVGRANPFLNAVTQLQRPSQIAGLFSPLAQAELDQFLHQSTFTGRQWQLSTKPPMDQSQQPQNYYGSIFGQFIPGHARNRVVLRELLSMGLPYRLLEQQGIPGLVKPLEGPQFDDALALSPRPRSFKDPATRRSIKKQTAEDRKTQTWGGLLHYLLPFTGPVPQHGAETLARERQKEADAANQAQGRKKKRRGSSAGGWGGAGGGSSSGGGGWGSGGGGGSKSGGGGWGSAAGG